MLVNFKEILSDAKKNGYAIPAFNVYNMETVMGVIYAAEELNSPVIIQSYSRLFREDTSFFIAPMVLAAANRAKVPVCFHLDHGTSELETIRAMRQGCTGVMIDASTMCFADNVALTKRVVQTAGYVNVFVEGELGHVGSTADTDMDEFTEPDQAARFVEQTGVAALAVLVGSAHGRYKKPPKLDIQRVADISCAAGIPLVLHGGSGIPDDQTRTAIAAGICKVNFATDLCYAFMDAVASKIDTRPPLDLFMKEPINAVKSFAENKIRLVGSGGRA
jgi:ketose-bisphosphate aldolase